MSLDSGARSSHRAAAGVKSRAGRADMDFVELMGILWRGKWVIVSLTTFLALAAIAYAVLATPWYRAEVLLIPAEGMAGEALLSQFGGLASLAGISTGDGASAEPLAVLESRDFTREFIEDQQLITLLFADDWDATAKQWKHKNPKDWPDWRDAVDYFDDQVRTVRENTKSGLVTLSIEWTDPETAAEWANLLVKRLNDRMRERALLQAQTNVSYLRAEMSAAQVVSLQQSIGKLLESELQKLMLARGNEEYSFKVIDPAEPPKRRARPIGVLVVAVGLLTGLMSGCLVVLVESAFQKYREPQGRVTAT